MVYADDIVAKEFTITLSIEVTTSISIDSNFNLDHQIESFDVSQELSKCVSLLKLAKSFGVKLTKIEKRDTSHSNFLDFTFSISDFESLENFMTVIER